MHLSYHFYPKEYEKLSALDEIEEALRFGRLKDARRTFEEYQRKNPAGRNRYRHIFEERISGILALEEYEDSLRSRQKERCPAEAETERKDVAFIPNLRHKFHFRTVSFYSGHRLLRKYFF